MSGVTFFFCWPRWSSGQSERSEQRRTGGQQGCLLRRRQRDVYSVRSDVRGRNLWPAGTISWKNTASGMAPMNARSSLTGSRRGASEQTRSAGSGHCIAARTRTMRIRCSMPKEHGRIFYSSAYSTIEPCSGFYLLRWKQEVAIFDFYLELPASSSRGAPEPACKPFVLTTRRRSTVIRGLKLSSAPTPKTMPPWSTSTFKSRLHL